MRATAVLSLVVLVAAVAPAWAAPPTLEVPAEVKAVGEYVRFTPKTDGVSVVYVGLSGLDPFPSEELKDPRRFLLHVRGLPAGRYLFAAVAASKDGDQLRADFAVVVGSGPTPPVPPTPPDPPAPADPLVAALKAAAASDGIGAAGLRALATAFGATADLTKNRDTAGAFQALLGEQIIAKLKVKPAATWAVVQAALAPLETVAPSDRPDKVMTDADKRATADLLRKVAASCEGAAK